MGTIDNFLSLKNVSKNFGGVQAVFDVSFNLQPGNITGMIGPNGAGKTTLFNLVSGTLPVSQGRISFNAKNITPLASQKRSRMGMMRTFQNLSLYPDLTVLENTCLGANAWNRPGLLSFFSSAAERKVSDAACGHLKLVGLHQAKDRYPDELSYGDQRRLEIARALTGKPSLLLLDEPAAGLNNQESQDLAELLLCLKNDLGLSILIIEHDMDVLMTISDRVLVLVEGQLLLEDTPKNVQNDPTVIEAYLGKEEDFGDL